MSRGRLALMFCAVAALAVVSGCSRPAAAPGQGSGGGAARTVEISGDDSMLFSEMSIAATPGERLRVVFTNTGTRPKESMGHNWVLLRPASPAEVNEYGLAAAAAAPTYLPADRKRQVIVATRMLGPGESDAVEFTVPSQPGEYPYICTFPGHFIMMRGWLVVK